MKVVVVSNMYPDPKHPSYGVFVKNFCNILDKVNIDYLLYIMYKSDSVIGKICGYIKFYIGTTIALLFKKYDLIYIHYASHSSIPVLMAHKLRKKPIFTNVHGSDVVPENRKQEKMQKYTKKILSISQKVVVPSEYFQELVRKKYGIEIEKIYVSPSGGINYKVFYKQKEKKIRKKLKLGYVGRISYKKGWDTLLKACAGLSIPFELSVIGNGPEYKKMRDLALRLGINDKINWLDLQPQEKLCTIYNEMDVFIFPTEREGESLGLVALEAMACGTPVIASDYAAPSYYVIDGENGYKYECGNSAALLAKIDLFYTLGLKDRIRLSNNAVKTADTYKISNISNQVRAILEIKK